MAVDAVDFSFVAVWATYHMAILHVCQFVFCVNSYIVNRNHLTTFFAKIFNVSSSVGMIS